MKLKYHDDNEQEPYDAATRRFYKWMMLDTGELVQDTACFAATTLKAFLTWALSFS